MLKINFNKDKFEKIFIFISFIIYFFYTYNLIHEKELKLNDLIILKENTQVIKNWLFWAIFQWQVAWFPVFLFIASFWKGSIIKRLIIIYPLGYIIGDNFFDIVLEYLGQLYVKELDSGTLYRTIVNSPQASLLVIIIILLLISLYLLIFKRKKIFWFSVLTMLAFLSMNIIYHVGLINGTLRDTVNYINQKQESLANQTNNGTNKEKLQSICNFEDWKCITFETNGPKDLNFTQRFKGYIGDNGINFLNNFYARRLYEKNDIKYYFLRRNFSISQDDTAYVGFTNIKFNELTNNYSGILIIDAKFFKNYFILADVYLTKMLVVGNLFWLLMMVFIVKFHEKFLNKKINKI